MGGCCAVLPVRHCPSPPPTIAAVNNSIISRSTGQPPADASLPEIDESYKKFRYFAASGCMLMLSVIVISSVWAYDGWHLALIAGIIFFYCTAMVLLVLKHCDRKEREALVEPELRSPPGCCQESTWMLVVTGIMLGALVPTVSASRTNWHDLGSVIFLSVVFTGACSMLIIGWDDEQKQRQDARKRERENLDRRALEQRPRI